MGMVFRRMAIRIGIETGTREVYSRANDFVSKVNDPDSNPIAEIEAVKEVTNEEGRIEDINDIEGIDP